MCARRSKRASPNTSNSRGIELDQLDHRNFAQAKDYIESESNVCLSQAEAAIDRAIAQLFNGRGRTLQRLSATFRRADLVEMLAPPRRLVEIQRSDSEQV